MKVAFGLVVSVLVSLLGSCANPIVQDSVQREPTIPVSPSLDGSWSQRAVLDPVDGSARELRLLKVLTNKDEIEAFRKEMGETGSEAPLRIEIYSLQPSATPPYGIGPVTDAAPKARYGGLNEYIKSVSTVGSNYTNSGTYAAFDFPGPGTFVVNTSRTYSASVSGSASVGTSAVQASLGFTSSTTIGVSMSYSSPVPAHEYWHLRYYPYYTKKTFEVWDSNWPFADSYIGSGSGFLPSGGTMITKTVTTI